MVMRARRGVHSEDTASRGRVAVSEVAPLGVSPLRLVGALLLLAAFYVLAGTFTPGPESGIRETTGLAVNAGVVLALSVIVTRRQFPAFVVAVVVLGCVLRVPDFPLAWALAGSLANAPAMVAFRILALRRADGFRDWGRRRSLLRLLETGFVAVLVGAVCAVALFAAAERLGWLSPGPPLGFLLGTRLLAHYDGVVAITPVMFTLLRRSPGGWPRGAWAEIGVLSGLVVVASAAVVNVPQTAPVIPLVVIVLFAGSLVTVMRRGEIAAAVLGPVLALGTAVMMLVSGERRGWHVGADPRQLLPGQLAGLVVAGLGWAVAVLVAERDVALARVQSERAAQQALASLQQALLPAHVVSSARVATAARYRVAGSSGRIGGDWYDAFDLPGGCTALVIGDVEGHDLHAASVMGLVRGAVRSYALDGLPPSIVLARVDGFLASAGSTRLVTMAYVEIHADGTTATVAVAGHPAPLALPPGAAVAAPVEVRDGLVLGAGLVSGWQERTVAIVPGSILTLYTDGLIDFPTAAPDEAQRLARTVAENGCRPLGALADTVISQASAYDDAAVLVARVSSSGVVPSARRTLPALTISAGLARVWLGDLIEVWRQAGLLLRADPAPVETAQLLLTELVSNAVRHSDHSVTVGVRLWGRELRVEVEDSSERMPVLRRREDAAAEGRGLRLVDSLASGWGAELGERGKVVWFVVGLDAALDAGADAVGTGAGAGGAPLMPSRGGVTDGGP